MIDKTLERRVFFVFNSLPPTCGCNLQHLNIFVLNGNVIKQLDNQKSHPHQLKKLMLLHFDNLR